MCYLNWIRIKTVSLPSVAKYVYYYSHLSQSLHGTPNTILQGHHCCILGFVPPRTIVTEIQTSQRVFFPYTEMTMGAARPFSRANTALWRQVWPCQTGLNVLVFSQYLGTGDVKDPDDARAEATREDLLTGMEGHRAGAVLWHKIIQLSTGDNNRYVVKQ